MSIDFINGIINGYREMISKNPPDIEALRGQLAYWEAERAHMCNAAAMAELADPERKTNP